MPGARLRGRGGYCRVDVPGTASMLLKVSTDNPRYFADQNGNIVWPCGFHTWSNFHDRTTNDPPNAFNNSYYLGQVVARNCNLIRLWAGWEQPHYRQPSMGGSLYWASPGPPYKRTGPANANDGKLKFDLTQFEPAFFARLASRVADALAVGVYVLVELFDGFELDAGNGFNSSTGGFPWQSGNNINGFALTNPYDYNTLTPSGLTAQQDLLIEKFVDTINQYPNVIWTICNEPVSSAATLAWIAHCITKLRTYEATKPLQHLIHMGSTGFPNYDDADLFASSADVISWADGRYDASDGSKIVLNDTDHSYFWETILADGMTVARQFPFKCLCQGTMPMFMDPWMEVAAGRNVPGGSVVGDQGTVLDASWDPLRNAIGDAHSYAKRINLKLCTPQSGLSATGFCLAKASAPNAQYVALRTNSTGSFNVTLVAGTYNFEWFDIANRIVNGTGSFTAGAGARSFTAPFSGAALLLLTS